MNVKRCVELLIGLSIFGALNWPCLAAADDADPKAAWQLEALDQDINVRVRVSAGEYRYTANGRCGTAEEAIDVQAFDEGGRYGLTVTRDRYSGMVLFFSNNESEWEVTLEPEEDTSELTGGRFRFSGAAMVDYEESNVQAIEVELVCPAS